MRRVEEAASECTKRKSEFAKLIFILHKSFDAKEATACTVKFNDLMFLNDVACFRPLSHIHFFLNLTSGDRTSSLSPSPNGTN